MVNHWTPGCTITPGIWFNVPDHVYRSLDGEFQTRLKKAVRRPMDYLKTNRTTPALEFGQVSHIALLKPELYPETVFVVPKEYSSSEAKMWVNQIRKKNPYCKFISREDERIIKAFEHNWHNGVNSGDIQAVMDGAETEVVIVWYEDFTDNEGTVQSILCKTMIDIVRPIKSEDGKTNFIVADLKTTQNATEYAFSKEIEDRLYHFQLAFNRRGLKKYFPEAKVYPMLFAAEKSSSPYEIEVYELRDSDGDLEEGDRLIDKAMAIVLECKKRNVWPAFAKRKDKFITRPAYAKRRNYD